MTAPVGTFAWTAYLLPDVAADAVPTPLVVELAETGLPDRLWTVDGLCSTREPSGQVPHGAVYRLRVTFPDTAAAVYTEDRVAGARLRAGVPADLPHVTYGGVDITESLAGGIVHEAPLADVLSMPSGSARRIRERAVLDEEDRRAAAIIAEGSPDVAALEAERRRPTPPRPDRQRDRRGNR